MLTKLKGNAMKLTVENIFKYVVMTLISLTAWEFAKPKILTFINKGEQTNG